MVLSRTEGQIKKWKRVVAEGWFGEGKGYGQGTESAQWNGDYVWEFCLIWKHSVLLEVFMHF